MPRDSGGQWDDANERLLLLTIIHMTAPQLPKWDEVAKVMDQGFTGNAIRYILIIYSPLFIILLIFGSQHFQKLRKECKEKFGEPDASVKKSTPRKTATPSENRATPGSATGKKRKTTSEVEGGNDVGEEAQSSKAIKTEDEETDVV